MFDNVKKYLMDKYDIEESMITMETKFSDLGISSFEFVEMCADIEDRFNIEIEDEKLTQMFTIRDLIEYIEKKVA